MKKVRVGVQLPARRSGSPSSVKARRPRTTPPVAPSRGRAHASSRGFYFFRTVSRTLQWITLRRQHAPRPPGRSLRRFRTVQSRCWVAARAEVAVYRHAAARPGVGEGQPGVRHRPVQAVATGTLGWVRPGSVRRVRRCAPRCGQVTQMSRARAGRAGDERHHAVGPRQRRLRPWASSPAPPRSTPTRPHLPTDPSPATLGSTMASGTSSTNSDIQRRAEQAPQRFAQRSGRSPCRRPRPQPTRARWLATPVRRAARCGRRAPHRPAGSAPRRAQPSREAVPDQGTPPGRASRDREPPWRDQRHGGAHRRRRARAARPRSARPARPAQRCAPRRRLAARSWDIARPRRRGAPRGVRHRATPPGGQTVLRNSERWSAATATPRGRSTPRPRATIVRRQAQHMVVEHHDALGDRADNRARDGADTVEERA